MVWYLPITVISLCHESRAPACLFISSSAHDVCYPRCNLPVSVPTRLEEREEGLNCGKRRKSCKFDVNLGLVYVQRYLNICTDGLELNNISFIKSNLDRIIICLFYTPPSSPSLRKGNWSCFVFYSVWEILLGKGKYKDIIIFELERYW